MEISSPFLSTKKGLFLLSRKVSEPPYPPGRKKELNRRVRRDRRAFSSKRLKHESIYECFIYSASSRLSALCGSFLLSGNQNFSFSGSSGEEDKGMNEEEAESAEILF